MYCTLAWLLFFFFQAEDGIRDDLVTGVQTCALPIFGDLFQLQDELAHRLVESLSLPLTAQERQQLRQDVPAAPKAYEKYLRANELSRETGGWQAALDLYRDCVKEDPAYAPAWAGLGRMHRMLGKYLGGSPDAHFREAEAAVRQALELNPELSPAENLYPRIEGDLA